MRFSLQYGLSGNIEEISSNHRTTAEERIVGHTLDWKGGSKVCCSQMVVSLVHERAVVWF